ncbi:MAG: DUF4249 domain-containing protein [Cyclobacteriaceae bacterium]|nr:DUF4249 domain-containing protein [Cyclobacteriaceae bacterium]
MKRGLFLLAISILGCVDPYNPKEITESESILVVDGFVNTSGPSKITLSRSQNLNNSSQTIYEIGAEVYIEDQLGNKISFLGDNFGNYTLASQPFTSSAYRLKIRLSNQKEYVSDFVPKLVSPQIAEITWGLTETSDVELKVSTGGGQANEPGFYRWTFDETWEYLTPYYSSLIFNPDTRSPEIRTNNITNCWRKAASTGVAIESTTRFSQNQVSDFVIATFKLNSERFKVKYSVLVKQQSLTNEAFNYWKQVKRSNEDLGTIFGPLPSEIISNIKSVSNGSEPVVGFFSISSITTKRIFIANRELPAAALYETPYQNCQLLEIPVQDISNFNSEPYLLVGPVYLGGGPIVIAYSYSSKFCVDCRLSGGTDVKPDYWE